MGNCQSASARRAVVDDGSHTNNNNDRDGASPRLLLDSWKANANNNSKNHNHRQHHHQKQNHGGGSPAQALDATEASLTDRETETATLTPDSTASASQQQPWTASPATNSTASASPEVDAPHHQQELPVSPLLLQHTAATTTTIGSRRPLSPVRGIVSQSQQKQQRPASPQQRRQGRALKARLEKARCLQLAMSHQQQQGVPMLQSLRSVLSSGGYSVDESIASAATPSRLSSSSSSLHPAAPYSSGDDKSRLANAEFEASFSSGTLWAEIDASDKVSAVAFSSSRQPSPGAAGDESTRTATAPTSDSSASPYLPLLLAVGTDGGRVTVSQVLSDSSVAAQSHPLIPQQALRRLGPSTTWESSSRIRSLDFSPGGRFLAVGGDDCCCTVLEIIYQNANGDGDEYDDEARSNGPYCCRVELRLYAELPRVDRVYAVQFRPSGGYLAVGGFDGTVAVYDSDFELVEEIVRDGLVFCLAWSHDGDYLALGGSDKCCAVVHAAKSWRVCNEIRRPGTVTAIQWYPTACKPYLAIGCASSTVAIVECNRANQTFTVKHEISMKNDETPKTNYHNNLVVSPTSARNSIYKVHALSWSTYLVVCGSDRKCTLLETKTFTQVHEIRRSDEITCAAWGQQSVLSGVPQRYLCLGGDDQKVVLMKAGLDLNASGTSDDLSSSSSHSSSNSSQSSVRQMDWTLKENVFLDVDEDVCNLSASRIAYDDDGPSERVVALAFSRGSKSRPSTFFAYSLDDGRLVVRSTIGDFNVVAELRFAKPIRTLAFSSGSRFLVLGSPLDSRVYVVETAPSWSVTARKEFFSSVTTVGFSKHNERIAVGTEDGVLTLLDPSDNYEAVGEIDVSESGVSAMDWSSRNFALGRRDGSVAVYDSSQVCSNFCVPLAELPQKSSVCGLAFGPSSRFLAVAGSDGLVNVYSAKGGWALCHQAQGPSSGLSSLAWNASGRFLAFGGQDGSIRMLDTVFWAEVEEVSQLQKNERTSLQAVSSSAVMVAFSQDGNMLALTTPDGDTQIVDTHKWKINFRLNPSTTEQLLDQSVMSV